ncbi:phage tail protein [Paenibacillus thermotolerans]|uniref:phage tail protein n=1 Tax=Paenibacillus thermotolerans TaxID=3027807 RepID=UPI00236852BE|nr:MULTISPECIES: tail fiber protein [unclassified Paenibacillus]
MDPYVGEIRLFAGKYAPRGWAFCDGSEITIVENSILFAVIGNQFGGDGVKTYKLPDLRGRVPLHQGQGIGLTKRPFASSGGNETVQLEYNQMPPHNHAANAVSKSNLKDPTDAVWASSAGFGGKNVYTNTPSVSMNALALGVTGGSQPHNNLQPYLTINFIIALEGIFPQKDN